MKKNLLSKTEDHRLGESAERSGLLRFQILDMGWINRPSAKWNFPENQSPFNRLYFIVGGDPWVKSKSKLARLSPRRAYLIPLNRRFDYGCDTRIEKFYIHFRLEYPPTFDLFDGTDEVLDLGKTPPGLAEKIFSLAKNPSPLRLAALESHLLAVLSSAPEPASKKSLVEWKLYERYRKVFEHIDLHLDAHLRITELARLQNQPLSAFSRSFHKDFGVNIKAFLDERLARRAKELLLTSDKKIREVAGELGFRDEYYFSRFFKRLQGQSPQSFRAKTKMS